jgi:polyphosphate:AMP phosphotransferase
MFETAELGRKLGKTQYAELVPELRVELLSVQKQAFDAKLPVVVLINGVDGSGKGDFLNKLYEWMDARYLTTEAYAPPTEEEVQRPPFWRYWMWLPGRGRIGAFLGSWYTEPILRAAQGEGSLSDFDRDLVSIVRFERALVADGALVVKLWFHLSKKEQRRRFKRWEKSKLSRWRVSSRDWLHHEMYEDFVRVCSRAIRTTSTAESPWNVVEGTDFRYRNVTAARYLIDSIRARLGVENSPPVVASVPKREDPETILDTLDMTRSLPRETYADELALYQGRINGLARQLAKRERSVTIVFEGSDASGKGGAIRRLIHALDARQYRVIPIFAPTEEERAHHYLWRVWRHVPRRGRFTIYDRSWYGRVLVERVEGFASESEWQRAYKEINDFEYQLSDNGMIVIKFWLHITPDEQLERFKERENSKYKQFKITEEDYRNRAKANEYEAAASEMIERTSTEYCPWTIIEANDKRYARVAVLKTIHRRLKAGLSGSS